MSNNQETTHRNILCISKRAIDFDAIKRNLQKTMGHEFGIIHCRELAKLDALLNDDSPDFDVILLDIDQLSDDTPRENFCTVRELAKKIPLIIMSEEKDHALVLNVIADGASDNVTKGSAKTDPYRMRDAIELALAHRTVRRQAESDSSDALKRLGIRDGLELSSTRKRGSDRLQQTRSDCDVALKEKNDIIEWLSGSYSVKH